MRETKRQKKEEKMRKNIVRECQRYRLCVGPFTSHLPVSALYSTPLQSCVPHAEDAKLTVRQLSSPSGPYSSATNSRLSLWPLVNKPQVEVVKLGY